MGAGQFVVFAATIVPGGVEILATEPLFPLVNAHVPLSGLRQIEQEFVTAYAREHAKDGYGAVALSLLSKRLKAVHVFFEATAE
jgi:hypothetical protein